LHKRSNTSESITPARASTSSDVLLAAPKRPISAENTSGDMQLDLLTRALTTLSSQMGDTTKRPAFGSSEETIARYNALYLITRLTSYLTETASEQGISSTDQQSLRELSTYLAHMDVSALTDDTFNLTVIREISSALLRTLKTHQEAISQHRSGLDPFTKLRAELSFDAKIQSFYTPSSEKPIIDTQLEIQRIQEGIETFKRLSKVLKEQVESNPNTIRAMKFCLFTIRTSQEKLLIAVGQDSEAYKKLVKTLPNIPLLEAMVAVRNHLRHEFKKDVERDLKVESAIKALAEWVSTGKSENYEALKAHKWLTKKAPRTDYSAQFEGFRP